MAEAESAPRSAVHEEDDVPEGDAQAWRARTRDSVPSPGAKVIDLTQRSRERMAQRWGKVIEEPPPPPADPDDTSLRILDALNQMHLYRDPTPSLKAVWLDLSERGAQVYEDQGLMLAVLYWLAGAPGFALVGVFKAGETVCARPGRIYPALVVLLALWIALAIAGLNPVPLSDLNPF